MVISNKIVALFKENGHMCMAEVLSYTLLNGEIVQIMCKQILILSNNIQ